MKLEDLENWLRSSHREVARIFELSPDWWPAHGWQGRSSALATAFFVTAAKARCKGRFLVAARSPGKNGVCQEVLEDLWASGRTRTHDRYEVLVDFSVHNWDSPDACLLTGESEMHGRHGVGDTMESSDDYSWDFYKLLVVPSSTRLFMARVAGMDGEAAAARCTQLADSLSRLISFYGPALLRPGDELGVVVLPASKRQNGDTILMSYSRGRLERRRVSTCLI